MAKKTLNEIISNFKSVCCGNRVYNKGQNYKCVKCGEDNTNVFYLYLKEATDAKLH